MKTKPVETGTIFIPGFHNEISTGARLLVSDQPMQPEGVKTGANDPKAFLDKYLRIGIDSVDQSWFDSEASAILSRRDELPEFPAFG